MQFDTKRAALQAERQGIAEGHAHCNVTDHQNPDTSDFMDDFDPKGSTTRVATGDGADGLSQSFMAGLS